MASPEALLPLPRSWIERLLLGVALVLIWLARMDPPGPPTPDLDPSWHTALADAHAHGRQFGRDVVFTLGPWSWIAAHYHLPETLAGKRAWEFGGKLLLSAVLVGFTLPLPLWRRWAFLGAVLVLGWLVSDLFMVIAVLAVLCWLADSRCPPWLTGLAIVLLALFTHMKFTLAIVCGSGVVLAATGMALQGKPRRAAAIAGGFAAAVAVLWLAAGQDLGTLATWWRLGLEVSSGYQDAMAIDESWPVFGAGIAVAAAIAMHVSDRWRHSTDRKAEWPALAFIVAAAFLAWKHGFTRADGHVLGFFLFALLLGIVSPARRGSVRRVGWLDACIPLASLGMLVFDPSLPGRHLFELRRNVGWGWHYAIEHRAWRADYDAALAALRAEQARPEIKAAVGNATVDSLGHCQGLLFLNGLRYHPRPVPQSYNAWTPGLLALDARFFASANAPDFLLVDYATIDGRFPAQDDSLVLALLRRRYEPAALAISPLLLLRRRDPPFDPGLDLAPIVDREIAPGEDFVLPAEADALWLQAWFEPTLAGRLQRLLYKPAPVAIVVTEFSGRQTRWRLIPPMAEAGFIVQPFLETPADLASFLRGDDAGSRRIRAIRFEAGRPGGSWPWSHVRVRASALANPGPGPGPVDPNEGHVRSGLSNVRPLLVRSALSVEPMEGTSGRALMVHAPGEMVFPLEGQRRTITGAFGFREGSFSGEGRTDGAIFAIVIRKHGGAEEVVWSRFLDPLGRLEDRGPQTFRVLLPDDAVQVVLRTDPGLHGNSNWDWTWWSEIQLSECVAP